MKNKWKSYTKTEKMDSVQNISFFFIDRTFSTYVYGKMVDLW